MTNWTDGELQDLEEKITSLENRVAAGEIIRMDMWRLILQLATYVARLSGVPESDLAEEQALTVKLLRDQGVNVHQGWLEGDAPRFGAEENDLDGIGET